jgi:hypothetical protein
MTKSTTEGTGMDIVWDGITRVETLSEKAAAARSVLADAAKGSDWPQVFKVLAEFPEFVNACRPGSNSFYSPLHQAAYNGAPVEVVQRLLEMGAWRTLQNAYGERPVDVAVRRNQTHLIQALDPQYWWQVPLGVLLKIQSHFHQVIRGRAAQLVEEHCLRLPELEPLLELRVPKVWFAVPGMYGGFSYRLETSGVEAKLVSESWCRVSGGSGQRHEITPRGAKLVDEGFT